MTHIRIYKELRKAIAGCLAVMLLPLFTACEHKDLCYDHSHTTQLEVVFDWTEAPDATLHDEPLPLPGGRIGADALRVH